MTVRLEKVFLGWGTKLAWLGQVQRVPDSGFRAAGILVGWLCLVLSVEGQTPSPAVSPAPSPTPAFFHVTAQQELIKLRGESRSQAAIDLAKRILTSFPVDEGRWANNHALRSEALEILKENDAIGGYIAELEERSRTQPEDLQINLALAEAFSLVDPEKATPYYEKADKISPENIGITLKLASGLAGSGHDEDAMQLYDQLLAEHLERTLSAAQNELFLLYSRQNALGRMAKQIVLGFNTPITSPVRSGPSLFRVIELVERFVKLGDEENAIVILQGARPSPDQPRGSEIRTQIRLDLALIELLIKHRRNSDAIQRIIRSFSPRPIEPGSDGSEFATELIIWEPDSSGHWTCPALTLLRKAEAISELPQLMVSIEAEVEKHPDEINQQTIYAVVAVWSRWEKAKPFLTRYFERISGLPPAIASRFTLRDSVTHPDPRALRPEKPPSVSHELLLAMGQQLCGWPTARTLVFPALAAAQAEFERHKVEPNRFMGLWPRIARIALAMNDRPQAQEVLRKVRSIAEEDNRHSRFSSTEQLLMFFEMMLRVRMKAEAAAILRILMDPNRSDAAFSGTREAALLRRAARLALDAGAIDLANTAANALPATLEAGLNDEEANPNDLFLTVQLLVQLQRLPEARALIDHIRQATTDKKKISKSLEQAEWIVGLFAGGEPDLKPAIFLASKSKPESKSTIHWDLVADTAPWHGAEGFVAAIKGKPAPFAHPYRLKILAGETTERLQRVAEVTTGEPRGTVRAALPPSAHFARVLLSGENGREIVGPVVRINATPNLILSSSFEGLARSSDLDHTAKKIPGWGQLPEGDWSLAADGPLAQSIRFRTGTSGQTLITGQRIAVAPGDEFFQSAWIEQISEARLRFGRRYLNREGVELGTSFCIQPDSPGAWLLVQQSLELESGSQEARIPGGCAFIEPVIEITAFDSSPYQLGQLAAWSGLYLGKLEKSPAKRIPPSSASILFSAKERPTHLAVSPDSRFIALGYPSGMIRLLNRQGEQITERDAGFPAVVALRFIGDSTALIAFGARGEIRRLTLDPSVATTVLMPPAGEIRAADITSDGATAVIFRIGKSDTSEGDEGRFEILDLINRKVIGVVDVQWPGVFNLIISDDGSRFYAVGNKQMYPQGFWLIPSGEKVRVTAEKPGHGVNFVSYLGLQQPRSIDVYVWAEGSPRAVCADPKRHQSVHASDGKIFVWDQTTRRNVRVFPHAGDIQRLMVIPDDGTILSIGNDGAVRQWTAGAGAALK